MSISIQDKRLFSLAAFLHRETLNAPWWKFSTKKSRLRHSNPAEAVESDMKKWVRGLAQRLNANHGIQVYRRVIFSDQSNSTAALFLRYGKEYYLFYVQASDIIQLPPSKSRYVIPISLNSALARLPRRYGRAYDILLPRYKRRLEGEGYLVQAVRVLRDIGVSENEWMLMNMESLSVEQARPKATIDVGDKRFSLIERRGVEASQSFMLGVDCYKARMVFEDYKAKYILIIPPIILWKWGHVVSPTAVYNVEKAGELCSKLQS
ncbi:MAG: hypothetical protein F7C33_04415 [Desulfurococcales archaeon]|nr:hypothetical protein [Desulfurococcales archaeon]